MESGDGRKRASGGVVTEKGKAAGRELTNIEEKAEVVSLPPQMAGETRENKRGKSLTATLVQVAKADVAL